MARNDRAVINTLCNPVSTDVQCMHYCDTAALHKYSALVCSRPDHNGQSVQFDYYPANTHRLPGKSANVCMQLATDTAREIARARVQRIVVYRELRVTFQTRSLWYDIRLKKSLKFSQECLECRRENYFEILYTCVFYVRGYGGTKLRS